MLVWVLKLEISTNLQQDAPSNPSSLTGQPYNPTSTVLVYDVAPRMLTCLFTRANGKVTTLRDAKSGEDVNTRRHCRHQHSRKESAPAVAADRALIGLELGREFFRLRVEKVKNDRGEKVADATKEPKNQSRY